MNLIELEPKTRREKSFPFALGLLSFVIVSLFVATLRTESTFAARPIQIEEKEILISALSRLQVDVPQLDQWTSEMKDQLIQSSLSIYVSGSSEFSEKHMMEVSEAGIAISPLFFASDPIAQESSLMRLVTDQNAPLKNIPEIAVVGE